MVQYQPGIAAPAGMERFIRPEHAQKAMFLPAERRLQYQHGILGLWNKALNAPDNSTDRISACQKLAEVTQSLQTQSQRAKQQAAQSSQANNPAQQSPPAQQQQQQQQQPQRPQQPQQPVQQPIQPQQNTQQLQNAQISRPQSQDQPQGQAAGGGSVALRRAQQLRDELKRFTQNLIPPSNLGGPEAQKWLETHRQQAANIYRESEGASASISNIQKQVIDKQKVSPLTDAEKAKVQAKLRETYERIDRLNEAIVNFKARIAPHQRQVGGGPAIQPGAGRPPGQEQPGPVQAQPQIKNEPVDQNPAASLAPAAASPAVSAPSQSSQPQAAVPGANQPVPPQANVNANVPTKAEPGRPMPNPLQSAQPYALSHQAAVDKARSYQQPAPTHTPTSVSAHHPHPGGLPSRADSQPKVPDVRGYANQTKTLNVAPLVPVAMNPGRPTMSGGPGQPAGVMGQPGLQRHPGYVLEGEGERVLSEKKLEELVREVTGSGGGEGSELLEQEVKETLLDLADEFVDNIIMAACKVAKLRSSSTLDIRDIQLILERNYNIRVPGYASDELRTVKKIVPSQAWAAKMSAVQAAKVTGGKGDI